MQSPYDSIASLYDRFVQTDLDIPFFLTETTQTNGDVLELMAGTGRVSLPLAEAGARLTCVDNSTEMLSLLRKKLDERGLAADVHLMDVRELALNRRFDLIFIPFHAFPEITEREDQARALMRIREHLSESGRFICTLHNPTVRLRGVDNQLRLVADRALPGGRLLVWLHQQAEGRLVRVKEFFETYTTDGLLTEKRFTEISFRLLEKSTFEELFQEAGFEAVELYGDYARAPFDEDASPFMLWVLKHGRRSESSLE
jgi:SAM-dependent methyltransferase